MDMNYKDVCGFECKYRISQSGLIFNKETGRFLKETIDKQSGYSKVNLFKDGKNNLCYVHRLVASTFIQNPNNFPQVHHKDGNKRNNSVENLEWVSYEIHGEKMTNEQKTRFKNTYQKNLKKRKSVC